MAISSKTKEIVIIWSLVGAMGAGIYFAPDIYEHFAKRYASAEREVFEKSKPFIHGTIENLTRMRLDYEMSDNKNHRAAIKRMVLSQTATIDKTQLPYELQAWVNSL